MPWFAQGRDAANGILSIRNGRLFLDWDVQKSAATIDAIVRTHEQLARSTGGAAIVPFTWTLSHDLITPHPLGGANMVCTTSVSARVRGSPTWTPASAIASIIR